jgi:hypothetical protein
MSARAYGVAVVVAALACASVSVPSVARAQRVAPVAANEARALFERGLAAADAERWGEAVLYFQRSLALVSRPSTQLNLGNALVRSGRPVEAERTLSELLASGGLRDEPARAAQARTMLGEARRAAVTLRVRVGPAGSSAAGVSLSLDGVPRAEAPDAPGLYTLRVDPGSHTLQASRGDGADVRRTVSALPGATVDVALEPQSTAVAAAGPATVTLSGAPDGAVALIDGVERGPAREALSLTAPGVYALEVRAPGFTPSRQTLRLRAGERLNLLLALAPSSRPPSRGVFASPAFWVVTGLVVAGAAVGVGLGVGLSAPQVPEYNGTTGAVLQGVSAAR